MSRGKKEKTASPEGGRRRYYIRKKKSDFFFSAAQVQVLIAGIFQAGQQSPLGQGEIPAADDFFQFFHVFHQAFAHNEGVDKPVGHGQNSVALGVFDAPCFPVYDEPQVKDAVDQGDGVLLGGAGLAGDENGIGGIVHTKCPPNPGRAGKNQI